MSKTPRKTSRERPLSANASASAATTRSAQRRAVARDATLRAASGSPIDVHVRNISVSGFAVVVHDTTLQPGEAVSIGIAGVGRHPATIVWNNGVDYGCQFRVAIALPDESQRVDLTNVIPLSSAAGMRANISEDPSIMPTIDAHIPTDLVHNNLLRWRGLIWISVIASPWLIITTIAVSAWLLAIQ